MQLSVEPVDPSATVEKRRAYDRSGLAAMAHRSYLAGNAKAAVFAGALAISFRSGFVDLPRVGSPVKSSLPENDVKREAMRREALEENMGCRCRSGHGRNQCRNNDLPHKFCDIPRLQWATRQLELWNHEPRARFDLAI